MKNDDWAFMFLIFVIIGLLLLGMWEQYGIKVRLFEVEQLLQENSQGFEYLDNKLNFHEAGHE